MLTRLLQRRAFISALLICLQLFGIAHVVVARHLVSDTGTVLELEELATERHEERGGHLCSDGPTTQAQGGEDCLVLAGWRSASLAAPVAVVLEVHAAPAVGLPGASPAVSQLEVLSRAPKASPPQG